jgi:hypothetical protein
METDRLHILLHRYTEGLTSAEEEQELMRELADTGNAEKVQPWLEKAWDEHPVKNHLSPEQSDTLYATVQQAIAPRIIPSFGWKRYTAAAAVIFIIGAGYLLYILRQPQGNVVKPAIANQIKSDVPPGKTGAVLTLTSGKTIVLDTAQNGKVLDNFTKDDESITVESSVTEYATLTTPKARTQQLVLSDGSRLWLNAASSIHFPTLFSGKERRVEITGEVYFEIAHNPNMPFHVKVNDMDVEVLGTHFNINSYNDEAAIKTTLLEGSVKVQALRSGKGNKAVVLKPGQQSLLNSSGQLSLNKAVDLEEVMAWKNGYFLFNAADIETIMRQVSRWYDVDVIYVGKKPAGHFKGMPSRDLTASQMLKVIEYGGVKIRIEGKKIYVGE